MGTVTLGGERLGAGKKQKVQLREYNRSTHNLSDIFRSTMASGTLVPFMSELALPGDSWEIDLDCDVKTHPTIGPLFGSYKVQLDVFVTPIRLYNGELHQNKLGIGMRMGEITLPRMKLEGFSPKIQKSNLDTGQVNSSSIMAYLGIRGLGATESSEITVARYFNAVPFIEYWDIYKNYYANKQEEIGMVIHNDMQPVLAEILAANIQSTAETVTLVEGPPTSLTEWIYMDSGTMVQFFFSNYEEFDPNRISIVLKNSATGQATDTYKLSEVFATLTWNEGLQTLIGTQPYPEFLGIQWLTGYYYFNTEADDNEFGAPKLKEFRLSNIDEMREQILQNTAGGTFEINATSLSPYRYPLQKVMDDDTPVAFSLTSTQEGLGIKTYQSDIFNNWISTEWIDGEDGINEITKISTVTGGFTIDELNLSNKIYNMLNRIAISGGTYDDWLDATYSHERQRTIENPVYMGGLSKELVFQEVISNASNADNTEPLGTLAGRGILNNKHKGGKVQIRVDEPSYIMGIVSITPRIDYSQGNKWDMNLRSLNDLHKPALDEIGFQDLITDQMAWWDTRVGLENLPQYQSAGKQPAWINYMTSHNKVYGNFAEQTQQMYMVLNRRYEAEWGSDGKPRIKDLTTYIDPTKFNHIFADTRIDAQNFWVQIGIDKIVRRKMSAKIIPNL